MDLTPYIESLRNDLTTTASAGDEQTRRAAAVLVAALEPSARLAIMNALSDLAAEVTAAIDDHVIDVRLSGRDVKVVITDTAEPAAEPEPEETLPPLGEGGDISRITVRLLEELKAKAEQAAATQGVSLNSFVQQAVHGALNSQMRGGWPGGGDWQDWQRGAKGKAKDKGNRGSSRVRGWVES